MKSHFDRTLFLSLQAPIDWQAKHTDDFALMLFAPPAPSVGGYRSNLGFSRSEPPALTLALVEQTMAAARAQQMAEYPGFVELAEERFEVDAFPAVLQRYQWQAPSVPHPFVQVFGLVLTDTHGLLELNGATLAPLAAEALPLFRAIIDSIRFIPQV